jgi:superfamily II RNA helicase
MVLNLLLSHNPEQISTLLDRSFASYMISLGKKKGKLARKQFGHDMEFLWNDFVEHMNFLIEEAYVTPDGKLTDDGIWASKLRMDTPLLVAQSIRHKLLPQSDPALLAAIIAAFVNEKEFTDDPLYDRATPQRLVTAFLEIRKKLRPFAVRMQEQGFFAPNLFIQPAALTYAWAHDTPWHQLMGKTDIAEGDFARLILRTAENLRQLTKIEDVFPRIAATAKESIDMILKEPVVTLYH